MIKLNCYDKTLYNLWPYRIAVPSDCASEGTENATVLACILVHYISSVINWSPLKLATEAEIGSVYVLYK